MQNHGARQEFHEGQKEGKLFTVELQAVRWTRPVVFEMGFELFSTSPNGKGEKKSINAKNFNGTRTIKIYLRMAVPGNPAGLSVNACSDI